MRHNIDINVLYNRTRGRLEKAPQSIHPLTPEEAFFLVRTIEYVSQSTSVIQQVIDLIESSAVAPSLEIQKAHALLISFRGNPTP